MGNRLARLVAVIGLALVGAAWANEAPSPVPGKGFARPEFGEALRVGTVVLALAGGWYLLRRRSK